MADSILTQYTRTGAIVTNGTIGTTPNAIVIRTPADQRAAIDVYSTEQATSLFLPVAGGAMISHIDMGNNPINNLPWPANAADAASKAYVDTTTISAAGDTMTGALNMSNNAVRNLPLPIAAADAANKRYVDDTTVSLVGDTMAGTLDMGGNFVRNMHDPVAAGDAATKLYVDTKFVPLSGGRLTGRITGVQTPLQPSDAVPKSYADMLSAGVSFKVPVACYTTLTGATFAYDSGQIITATLPGSGTLAIDGYTVVKNEDRILINAAVQQTANGVYTYTSYAAGVYTLTRAADTCGTPLTQLAQGGLYYVANGAVYGGSMFVQSSAVPILIGWSIIVYSQYSSAQSIAAGPNVAILGNQIGVSPTLAGITAVTGLLPPVNSTDATNKLYVDTAVAASNLAGYLPLTGGTLTSGTLTGIPAPINPSDAVPKSYADAISTGVTFKPAVACYTTLAGLAFTYSGRTITLTLTPSAPVIFDSYTVALGADRCLVNTPGNLAANGVYLVTASLASGGSTIYTLTRADDLDGSPISEFVLGGLFYVEYGAVYGGSLFVQSSVPPVTLGVSPIVYTQYASAPTLTAGANIAINGNQISVVSPLQIAAAPVAGTDAANKSYVDTTTSAAITTCNAFTNTAVAGIVSGSGYVPTTGGTMTGDLAMGTHKISLANAPATTTDAANKAYVDATATSTVSTCNAFTTAAVANVSVGTGYLPLAGGTMTGNLAMGANKISLTNAPVTGTDAANKAYVDTAISNTSSAATISTCNAFTTSAVAGYLPLVGGTMTGPLTMGANKISLTNAPATSTDAANKAYVDTVVSSASASVTTTCNTYTNTVVAAYMPLAGGSLSGTITCVGSGRITGLPTPSNPSDAVSKSYADLLVAGVSFMPAVACYSTLSGVTFAAPTVQTVAITIQTGPLIMDSYTVVINTDRILLNTAATPSANGIYVYTSSAVNGANTIYTLTRTSDMDGSPIGEFKQGGLFYVTSGTVFGGSLFVQTSAVPATLGTSVVAYSQYSAAQTITGGANITVSGNQISLAPTVSGVTSLTGLSAPVIAADATNKAYVDAAVSGVNTSTTSAITTAVAGVNTSTTTAITTAVAGVNTSTTTAITTAVAGVNTSTTAAIATAVAGVNTSTTDAITTAVAGVNTSTTSAITTAVAGVNTSTTTAITTAVAGVNTSTTAAIATAVSTVNTSTTAAIATAVSTVNTSTATAIATAVAGVNTSTTATITTAVADVNTSTTAAITTAVSTVNTSTTTALTTAVAGVNTSTTDAITTAVAGVNTSTTSAITTAVAGVNTSTTSAITTAVAGVNTSTTAAITTAVSTVNTSTTAAITTAVAGVNTSTTAAIATATTTIEAYADAKDVITLASAATYTNTKASSYLPLSGGTMSGTLTGIATPQNASDAAPKSYVDLLVAGVSFMPAVACYATLIGVSFTYNASQTILITMPTGPLIFDGYTPATTDRILINCTGTPEANGVYLAGSSSVSGANTIYTLTRSTDLDGSPLVEFVHGGLFYVTDGTVYGGSLFVQISESPTVLGTSAILYSQYSAAKNLAAGANVILTGNQVAVAAALTGITSITGLSAPAVATGAANKDYVDTSVAAKLDLVGGTLTGDINMGVNKITLTEAPTTPTGAANKAYVDDTVAGVNTSTATAIATAVSTVNTSTATAITTAVADVHTSTTAAITTAVAGVNTSTTAAIATAVSTVNTSTTSAITTAVAGVNTSTTSAITTAVAGVNTSTTSAISTAVAGVNTSTTAAITTAVAGVNTSTTTAITTAVAGVNTSTTDAITTAVAGVNTSTTAAITTAVAGVNTSTTAAITTAVAGVNTSTTAAITTAVAGVNTSTTDAITTAVAGVNTSTTAAITTAVAGINTSTTASIATAVAGVNTSTTTAITTAVAAVNTSTTTAIATATTTIEAYADAKDVITLASAATYTNTKASNYLPLSGGAMTGTLTGIATPQNASDAAPKSYVDLLSTSLNFKSAVACYTTLVGAIFVYDDAQTLSVTVSPAGPLVFDGHTVVQTTDRCLINTPANLPANGIYIFTSSASSGSDTVYTLTRTAGAGDTILSELSKGNMFYITYGAAYGGSLYVQTSISAATIGTSQVVYSQYSSAQSIIAGTNVNITGNQISLTSALSSISSVTGLSAPVAATDAANKTYVDNTSTACNAFTTSAVATAVTTCNTFTTNAVSTAQAVTTSAIATAVTSCNTFTTSAVATAVTDCNTYTDTVSAGYLAKTGGTLTSGTITNVPSPSAASDIVPKSYVDMLVAGVSFMPAVSCYTTLSGLSFSYDADQTILITIPTGPLIFDGYTPAATDRILINCAGVSEANGVYLSASSAVVGVNTIYTLTRSIDLNGSPLIEFEKGGLFYVTDGTVFGGSLFVQTSSPPSVLGTSPIIYSQYAAAKNLVAGANVVLTGNQVAVSTTLTGITSITGLSVPSGSTDAANKTYVDNTSTACNAFTTSAVATAVTDCNTFATNAVADAQAVTTSAIATATTACNAFTTSAVATAVTACNTFTTNAVSDAYVTTTSDIATAVSTCNTYADTAAAGYIPLTGGTLTSGTITNVPAPSAASDMVPKSYVDMLVAGVSFMPGVECYSTLAGISFSYDDDQTILVTIPTGPLVLDGHTVAVGTDRVLINTAGTPAANGVYLAATSAVSGLNTVYTLTRAADTTGSILSEFVQGGLFYVNSGTVFGGSLFVQSSDVPAAIGTSPITYSQYAAAKNIVAGPNVVITGNQVDVAVNMTSITSITGLATPVNPGDAANMAYVDSTAADIYTYVASADADTVTTCTNFATSAANAVSAVAMGAYSQSWHTTSNVAATTYTNTHTYPIVLSIICATDGSANGSASLSIDSTVRAVIQTSTSNIGTLSTIVPAASTYRVTLANGATISGWHELY